MRREVRIQHLEKKAGIGLPPVPAVKFVTATTIVKWKMPAWVPFAADRSQRGEAAGVIVQELTQKYALFNERAQLTLISNHAGSEM